MLFALQILPLVSYARVRLHLRHCLCPLETILMILLYEMGKNDGIGTLDTVGRQHTDEQQIYSICLMPLEHLQQIPPSPRQKLAVACLLQGSGKRGEGNAKAYQLSDRKSVV